MHIDESKELPYYRTHSIFTDPQEYQYLYKDLPTSIPDLCDVIHGLVVHRDALHPFYNLKLPDTRKNEADTRYVKDILHIIHQLDSSSLTNERIPEKRFIGSCRDFAILLCSILRTHHIPARLRCGFASYFRKGLFSDHWICEYWSDKDGRWIMVDSEIGKKERVHHNISSNLNHFDLTNDEFIFSGKAWQLCREMKIDPNLYGVHLIGIKGLWFVRADLLRDNASLNKVELLPWDYPAFFDKQFEKESELKGEELKLLDTIAALTLDVNINYQKIMQIYQTDTRLQVGNELKSYTIEGKKSVALHT